MESGIKKLPMLESNITSKKGDDKENSLEIFKTLFEREGIETKTELNQKQIVIINQKLVISRLLGFDELADAINNFMVLQVSKDRKGRHEFVDGIKAEYNREERQQTGFMSRMFGGGGNRQ